MTSQLSVGLPTSSAADRNAAVPAVISAEYGTVFSLSMSALVRFRCLSVWAAIACCALMLAAGSVVR